MQRYGSGLYDQIEVFDDPDFYHKLCDELKKASDIEISLPIYKAEGIPLIVEIVFGTLSAIASLLKIYEIIGKKTNTKVVVRFQNNRLVELNAKGINELKLLVENSEKEA